LGVDRWPRWAAGGLPEWSEASMKAVEGDVERVEFHVMAVQALRVRVAGVTVRAPVET